MRAVGLISVKAGQLNVVMFQFVSFCLFSLAAGAPSKLGGHGHHDHAARGGRQAGSAYLSPVDEVQAAGSLVETRVAAPIGIRSYNFEPSSAGFRYSYETENEIKQEAEGSMKNVDGADVMVMKGSYSYVGADGQEYVVDWYADETGYHPSAPHLPVPVQPIHPEIVAAVEAQLRFAAEEEAAKAAASTRSESYAAPPALPGYGRY